MRCLKYSSIFLIFLIFSRMLFAGNTGKIAGRVTDKSTGDPLIGVNVVVKGSSLGAATDEEGFYYILQVPPGTYDLECSYIGYHTLTVREVRVKVDLTQRVDIKMESNAIEGPAVEVFAKAPIVQKDVTSTRKVTSREEIAETPGFESTADIFMLQGGAFTSAAPQSIQLEGGAQLQVRDESLKDIHVRGGRGGEILYMVDGVPVTHPIYGGRDVLNLNVVDVQEMELLTGAFNAEYGQAQSGVVNITTRSGGDHYEGGIEYKTSQYDFFNTAYDMQYTSFYLGGPDPISSRLLPGLGIHLPGKLHFFLSGNGTLSNTPYNNSRTRDTFSLFGLNLKEKQDNTGNLNAKIGWNVSNKLNLNLSYHGSWNNWSNFDWLWKNYPDHMADYVRNNQNFIFRINHTLSKSTFYNINFGYLGVKYAGSLNGKNPGDFWRFYKDGNVYDYQTYKSLFSGAPDSIRSTISPATTDIYGFVDPLSYDNIWRDDATATYTFKGDITSQIHPEHLVKTGIEMKYNDIQYVDIQDGGVALSNYGKAAFENEQTFVAPIGPYPEFGQNRWVFNAYPIIGGAYIQDKFEKETLIINAGARLDWLALGSTVMNNNWKRQWESATGLKADWNWLKLKFSPRFGISFPISEKTVVFFSYGHFNQLPELQYFYRDPYTGGFTGNPHLDFEQTILYEFGFTRQLATDWALDIKSYAKDISKQVETTQLRAALGLPVYLYDNKGYGRARGLEFSLNKRYSHYFSTDLTYTVQWATGYSSSAFDNYIRSLTDFPNPIRERALSWDIRHQVIFQGTIAIPPHRAPKIFGITIPDNWNATVLSRFSTGQPYTPYSLDPVVQQKTENTKIGPSTMVTDLKIKKTFGVGNLGLSVFADILNIFNQRNVQIAYGFNTLTGKPFKYGDLDPQLISNSTYRYIGYYDMLTKLDPRQFASGRDIRLGLSINW
ncbi:MAG: TonB-dependent receptor [Calditrichia bacterium]